MHNERLMNPFSFNAWDDVPGVFEGKKKRRKIIPREATVYNLIALCWYRLTCNIKMNENINIVCEMNRRWRCAQPTFT